MSNKIRAMSRIDFTKMIRHSLVNDQPRSWHITGPQTAFCTYRNTVVTVDSGYLKVDPGYSASIESYSLNGGGLRIVVIEEQKPKLSKPKSLKSITHGYRQPFKRPNFANLPTNHYHETICSHCCDGIGLTFINEKEFTQIHGEVSNHPRAHNEVIVPIDPNRKNIFVHTYELCGLCTNISDI